MINRYLSNWITADYYTAVMVKLSKPDATSLSPTSAPTDNL